MASNSTLSRARRFPANILFSPAKIILGHYSSGYAVLTEIVVLIPARIVRVTLSRAPIRQVGIILSRIWHVGYTVTKMSSARPIRAKEWLNTDRHGCRRRHNRQLDSNTVWVKGKAIRRHFIRSVEVVSGTLITPTSPQG